MDFTPEQVAARLRRIASDIDESSAPDAAMVRKDIQLVIAALERDNRILRVATEILRIAQDDVNIQNELVGRPRSAAPVNAPEPKGGPPKEVGLWDTEEGKSVDDAMAHAKRKDKPDDLSSALVLVMRKIKHFVDWLRNEKEEEYDDSGVVTSAPPR